MNSMYVFVIIMFSFFACKDGSQNIDSGINAANFDTLKTDAEPLMDTVMEMDEKKLIEQTTPITIDPNKQKKSTSVKIENISNSKHKSKPVTDNSSELKDFVPTEAVHPQTIDETTTEKKNTAVIVKEEGSDIKEDKSKSPVEKDQVKPERFNHDLFDGLLSKYVSKTGVVNYSGFKNDEGKLDSYLSMLERTPIEKDWSNNKKLAFWINLYNASTIKLILQNLPISSIMNLDGGKVWDRKWVKQNGNNYSLNHIEHEIIRPRFKDSRIHFAVNCAAKSCPPIWSNAWTEQNLSKALDQVTRTFINNNNYNEISSKTAVLSKIFEWYASDFGDLVNYINKYSNVKITNKTNIEFQEYDWALNGK